MIIFLMFYLLIIYTINRLIVWSATILRMMTETLNNKSTKRHPDNDQTSKKN